MKMPAVARALAAVTSCPVFADPPKEVMNIVREADIKFQPARYPGIQSAIVSGNLATRDRRTCSATSFRLAPSTRRTSTRRRATSSC
jgi:hypothetical protein